MRSIQGVGGLLGGLCSATVLRRIGERRLVAAALALLGFGTVVAFVAVQLPLVEAWMRWGAMGGAQALIGFCVPWIIVGVVTLRMRLTPPRLQGRTSAALNVSINVPQMLMLALGSALLTVVDFRWLVGVAAAGVLVAALAAWSSRRLDAPPAAPAPQSSGTLSS